MSLLLYISGRKAIIWFGTSVFWLNLIANKVCMYFFKLITRVRIKAKSRLQSDMYIISLKLGTVKSNLSRNEIIQMWKQKNVLALIDFSLKKKTIAQTILFNQPSLSSHRRNLLLFRQPCIHTHFDTQDALVHN